MLVIDRISKAFFDPASAHVVHALSDVSLPVRDREFVSILGPSGCGKTTLIRVVAGLERPRSGSVTLDGTRLTAPSSKIAMVFQNYGLLPWRNVLANVEFGLTISRVDRATRRERALSALATVGLAGVERLYPHQLSGGMQQRVALARALAKDPQVFLMDEPFAAVDMQTRERLQDELLRIWDGLPRTILFVTHSVEEAAYLSDRVVVMRANPGQISSIVDVPISRPRESRTSKEFTEVCDELRASLHKLSHPSPISGR